VKEKTVVGTIIYELNGKVIEQFKVYTAQNIEKSTFWNRLKKWLKIVQYFVENLTKK
jgi:D-alanyl-D-alanine carboxypeptidase